MAPQVVSSTPEPWPTEREAFVDGQKSSAQSAHPSSEDQDHHDHDERPHACNDGWVTIGQIVVDDETGEEVEEFAMYLCRKCVERS
jgi:hypothetical protein